MLVEGRQLIKTAKKCSKRLINTLIDPPTKKHTTKEGDVIDVPFLSITGLALWLGFESRQSFYDYEKKDGFTYTIKRARALIENEYEFMLAKR